MSQMSRTLQNLSVKRMFTYEKIQKNNYNKYIIILVHYIKFILLLYQIWPQGILRSAFYGMNAWANRCHYNIAVTVINVLNYMPGTKQLLDSLLNFNTTTVVRKTSITDLPGCQTTFKLRDQWFLSWYSSFDHANNNSAALHLFISKKLLLLVQKTYT